MQQLSNLDAVFLSMETPEAPGHIGGLAILDPSSHPDGGFDFDRFVDFARERLALCPRFSWTLQEVPLGLDRPYWVETEDFDARNHIHRLGAPSPGGHRELAEISSLLYPRVLDRSKPLWDMTVIEGLQGGRVAVLWRLHHCMMDGASGAGLVELLFDLEPTPAERPLIEVRDEAAAGKPVGTLEMFTTGVRNALGRPSAALRHLSTAASELTQQLREHGLDGAQPAPHTSFNGVLSAGRSVAWSRISFDRVKHLKRELGVTVNDVVLAMTSGAVRNYLEARDELPGDSLYASVPVSLRSADDKSIGNQVGEVSVEWATDREDPLERLFAIHEAATAAKAGAKAGGLNLIEAMGESLAPGVLSLLARATSQAAEKAPLPSNAVVSNVPMSPVPMYIIGARIEGMVPMSLLAPTQGFNITVVTYNGEMHFGVVADPKLVENVWEIADGIPKALGALEEAAEADPRFAG